MHISWVKTKLQNIGSCTQGHPSDITVDGNTVEQVDNFTYLGSTQSSNGGSQADIKRRIVLASSVMSSLHHVWRDRYLSSPTKIREYQTLVLPVLLYACEAWTVLAADASVPYEVPTPNYEDPLAGPYTEHRCCVTHRPLPCIGPHHTSPELCLWTHR